MSETPYRIAAVKRIARSRTRAAVRELLEGMVDPSQVVESLPRINAVLESDRIGFFEVLVDTMEDPDPRYRVLAAWGVRLTIAEEPDLERDQLDAKARGLFREALAADGSSEQSLALFVAADGWPGDEIVEEQLRRLLHEGGERAICAAAALSGIAPGDSVIIRILRSGLGGRFQGTWVEATAAQALASLGIASAQPANQLAAQLGKGDAAYKFWILRTLRDMGTNASVASPALRMFIDDERNSPFLRSVAVTALARASRDAPMPASPLLRKMIQTSCPDLVRSAARAMSELQLLTERDVKDLVLHLHSSDDRLRQAAAEAIGAAGPLAATVVDHLLECARAETNLELTVALADACTASGVATIPRLIDEIRERYQIAAGVLGVVVSRLGREGVLALAEELICEADPICRSLLVVIMRDLQEEAAPAVPALATMLSDPRLDVEHKLLIMMALESIGPHAKDAAPALVECLGSDNGDVVNWARRALWRVDPEGTAPGTMGWTRDADDGRVEGSAQSKLAPLADSVLLTFVLMCEVMGEKRMGLYTVARKLEALKASGEVPEGMAITNQTLGNNLGMLEDALGVKLLGRARRTKGSITDAGWRYLPIIEACLQRRKDGGGQKG